MKEVEKQLAFLLFPFVLSRMSSKAVAFLFHVFAFSLGLRFFQNLISVGPSFFDAEFYTKLPLHYPYFGIYTTLCGLFFLHQYLKNTARPKFSQFLFFLFFTALTLVSSSRNAGIFYFISLGILFILKSRTPAMRWLVGGIYLAVLLSVISFLPRFSNFSDALLIKKLSWECSFESLNTPKKWLVGVGTGNAQNELQICYCNHQSWFCDLRYDSHNQYLSFLLTNGLGSFLAFIFLIGSSIRISIQRRSVMLFFVAFSLAVSSISESVLLMNKGIIFYTFWLCILLMQKPLSEKGPVPGLKGGLPEAL